MSDTISDFDALAVRCAKCRQPAGRMCVYVIPNNGYPPERLAKWPSLRVQMERAGQPAKRCHPERRASAWRARMRREAEERKRAQPMDRATLDRIAAWQAQRDWDRRERTALYQWLKYFGAELLIGGAK